MKRGTTKKPVRFAAGRAALSAALIAAALPAGCLFASRDGGHTDTALPSDTALPTDTAPSAFRPHAIDAPVFSAPGEAAEENDKAVIDYSNASDGYVMVKYRHSSANRLVALIDGPDGDQYFYYFDSGDFVAYPLTEGDGQYVVTVCEQANDMKLKVILRAYVDAALTDPFAPFLRPNQHVNYDGGTIAVRKAAELAEGSADLLDVISVVYDYATASIAYDTEMVGKVESGYMPDLDAVLERGKGICFDYAAVMTAMLRSLGIPTKMVFGYLEDYYHAWISVYSEEEGWIDGVIFFDGHDWELMDPTFTSGRRQSGGDTEFREAGTDYIAKLHY